MGLFGPGFYGSYLFDNDYRQRHDINLLKDYEGILETDVATLHRQVVELRKMVFDLQVTTRVAFQMLNEAGHLDLDVLKYRVEAQLEELTGVAVAGSVTCTRCGRAVPKTETTLTGDGTLCPGCAPP
jgi:hypothetical protein